MTYQFTPSQAKHAQEVADMLFKQRRFFLPAETDEQQSRPYLSTKVFEQIYKLNKMFLDKYYFTAKKAETELLKLELDYEITAPKLKVGQTIASCNRYSGGFDIAAIVPLQALLPIMPTNIFMTDIADELMNTKYPAESRDDFAPRIIHEYHEAVKCFAQKVVQEAWDVKCETEVSAEDKVVVVLETRFEPSSFQNNFMEGKLDGLITYPHLVSYLLFKQALAGCRLTEKMFTVCTSLRRGHICLEATHDGPVLIPDKTHGYECKVAFATIL